MKQKNLSESHKDIDSELFWVKLVYIEEKNSKLLRHFIQCSVLNKFTVIKTKKDEDCKRNGWHQTFSTL